MVSEDGVARCLARADPRPPRLARRHPAPAKLRLLVKKTEDGGPVELARSALADVERLGAAGAPAPPRNGADVRPRTRQK